MGKISAGRIGTELTGLLEIKHKCPGDAFLYGLEETVRRGIDNRNYIKAVAKAYNPDAVPAPRRQAADQGPTVAQAESMRIVQATQDEFANMTDEQQASLKAKIEEVREQAKQIGKGFEEND